MPDSQAKKQWMKKNKKTFSIGLMIRTEKDIIDRLDREPQKAAYIKRLIREDIKREQQAPTPSENE